MKPIATERLVIRNFRADDAVALREMIVGHMASDLAQYDRPWPTGEAEIAGIARWFAEGDRYLAVVERTTGRLVGLLALDEATPPAEGTRNFGYIFHPAYHGRGYATEAGRAILRYAFAEMGIQAFVCGTAEENLPSRRLLTRLGFRRIEGDRYRLDRPAVEPSAAEDPQAAS